MLQEKDKIFSNLYGFGKWNLEGAKSRGIWSNTEKFIAKGREYIIEEIKKVNFAGEEERDFLPASSGHLCLKIQTNHTI